MNRREVRWERMFADELEAAMEKCPAVFLPYGLCEPHGPQNALGMDGIRAHSASCLAARRSGGIVAPASFWHIHEQGIEGAWACEKVGEARPWLTAVPVWVFLKNLFYHLRGVDALGFHAAVVFSGHAGPFVEDVHEFLETIQPYLSVRVRAIFSLTVDSLFADGKGQGGHAGRGETSILWASDPDCVDLSRVPKDGNPRPRFAMGEMVFESDRRVGEKMLEQVVGNLGKLAKELLSEYKNTEAVGPLTFDGVERVWTEKIQPLIPSMRAMQDLRPGQKPPPESSRWHHNWRVRCKG